MGQANNKMSRNEAHSQVASLKWQIESKRSNLSAQFDELNRRRRRAVSTMKDSAKNAGFATVGLICLGSLTNAVLDLFRKGSHSTNNIVANSSTPLLASVAKDALRWAVIQLIALGLTKLKTEFSTPQSYHSQNAQPLSVDDVMHG